MNRSFTQDIIDSFKLWRYWFNVSSIDIKNKYSRTLFGPIWVTGTVAITIFAMGPLFGIIFNRPLDSYLLHLSTGMVFWIYISSCIGESCGAFIENITIIKNTDKPLYIYVFRIISRNTLVLFHNLIIPILIAAYFGYLSMNIFFLLPALVITIILVASLSFPIAIICSRYRDFIPLTQNILQLFFFLTPIFWVAGTSTERFRLLHLNPFDYVISLLRSPFYSEYDVYKISILFLFILFFTILSVVLYNRFCKKLSYWL